jgi:ketosteroid isomerase-like protein
MTDSSNGEHPHLRLVRDYLRAIEENADEARLASFFTPDVVQREYPNRLLERGVIRNLAQLLEGSRKGRSVVQHQRYLLTSSVVEGDRVAVEVTWTAELKVGLGKLAPGDTLRAESAMFFRLRDGRLAQQHNFDCFEPF